MDASKKVARQRLSVLELAEKLGNAAEAAVARGFVRIRRMFDGPLAATVIYGSFKVPTGICGETGEAPCPLPFSLFPTGEAHPT